MKYIAFYDLEEFKDENRSVTPSTLSLVRYMADVFSQEDVVEIISPTRTLNRDGIYKGRVTQVNERIALRHPPTFGTKTMLGKFLAIAFVRVWLFFYLLIHLKRGENIIVYHSLAYMFTMRLMKKIKKVKIVLEIREIYSDVKESYSEYSGVSKREKLREINYFNIGDAYIFPTEMLNRVVNANNKPYLVATGIYQMVNIQINQKWNDKIHIVYAGTLSKEKGGTIAAETAMYLSENYHVHILGYGSEIAIKELKTKVEKISQSTSALVTYDGLLKGSEFESFLQSCHIGLSPQNPIGSYNETSFPSKILTYLSNGLDVLTIRIPAIENSVVGDYLYYFDEQDPKTIAKAIKEIDIQNTVSKKDILDKLDLELKQNIRKLLSGMKG